MHHNVNCVCFRTGGRCDDDRVKKSLWGIGPRLCMRGMQPEKECPHQVEYARPEKPSPRAPITGGRRRGPRLIVIRHVVEHRHPPSGQTWDGMP